jgi:hypothetical protein
MNRDQIANASLFVMCAKALFGEHWIGPTAQMLGVNERTLRRLGAAEREGEDAVSATSLLRPMLEQLRQQRRTLDKVITYVEAHALAPIMAEPLYATLRFLELDRFDRLAGYGDSLETCRLFGWVAGLGSQCLLTELGEAAVQTEYAARERLGLPLNPDPRFPGN